jgi:hypothetical protein
MKFVRLLDFFGTLAIVPAFATPYALQLQATISTDNAARNWSALTRAVIAVDRRDNSRSSHFDADVSAVVQADASEHAVFSWSDIFVERDNAERCPVEGARSNFTFRCASPGRFSPTGRDVTIVDLSDFSSEYRSIQ